MCSTKPERGGKVLTQQILLELPNIKPSCSLLILRPQCFGTVSWQMSCDSTALICVRCLLSPRSIQLLCLYSFLSTTAAVATGTPLKSWGDSSPSTQSWHTKLIIWRLLTQSIWQVHGLPSVCLPACQPACLPVWLPVYLHKSDNPVLQKSYGVRLILNAEMPWPVQVGN